MGFIIHEDNSVELVRGNYFAATVTVLQKGTTTPYEFAQGDKLVFALKSNKMALGETSYVEEEPLLIKEIPTDTLLLELQPEDTKALPFGKYEYEISLIPANGKDDTFIEATEFMIKKRVGD